IIAAIFILSFYGGGFSTVPAYLKDMFGVFLVGGIHGRLLTAWSAAGVAGALIVICVVECQAKAGYERTGMYTLSMLIMVGLLAVGLNANILMHPVAEKHTIENGRTQGAKQYEYKS